MTGIRRVSLEISRVKKCLLALIFVSISSPCWGWGTRGHETVETVAANLMADNSFSRLLKKNIKAVRYLSMTPDMAWKHGSTPHILEGEAHFFQFNFYSPHGAVPNPDIKFYADRVGAEAIEKKGTAPWRMAQMTALLVKTFQKPRLSELEVIQMAATLGHYVGDLGNPLHVAEDYDGVGVGQKGLHSFFESVTVESIPEADLLSSVTQLATPLLARIPQTVTPIGTAMTLASAANEQSKIVLGYAKSLGLTGAFQVKAKPIIATTLAMSSAVLAKIWNTAYVSAGSPSLKVEYLGKVPIPDWVPVNYIPGEKAD